MNIEKVSQNKNIPALKRDLMQNKTNMLPVQLDNGPTIYVGYTDEKDKQNAIKAIQSALNGSENPYEALGKLMSIAYLDEKEIMPDEEVNLDGDIYIINYAKKIATDLRGETVVTLDDIKCNLQQEEVIKALLVERLKNLEYED